MNNRFNTITMKKILLSIAILFALLNTCFAQENTKNFISYAVRVGDNYSTLIGTNVSCKWKTGFNIGATVDFAFTDAFSLRPGVYFSMKGFKDDNDDNIRFNYLETPILAIFSWSLNSNMSLELQTGPYFAYGIGGKTKDEGLAYDPVTQKSEYRTFEDKVFDHFDRFDWGLNAGVGLNIHQFYVGTAYELGITKIINGSRHNCYMINFGYTFKH